MVRTRLLARLLGSLLVLASLGLPVEGRAAEKTIAGQRRAEIDGVSAAAISADEWRAAWPAEVADDIDSGELKAVEPDNSAQ